MSPNDQSSGKSPPAPSGRAGRPLAQRQLSLPGREVLRILIVDDHAIVRDGLKRMLGEHFPNAILSEARSAEEAIDCVRREPWSVILLDISMPGQSGLDVLKEIKSLQPEVKVLVLTMHPEDQYALRVLKAGASGYLTKETASGIVAQAVEKVLAGGKYLSAALAGNLVENLNTPAQKLPHETLSDREYQVFRMIALGKSVKEIGFDLSLSIKTVSTYRTRVLAKLNFSTNAEVIRYALREKLVE
jgi:two-component system invasion response regulator UvrY